MKRTRMLAGSVALISALSACSDSTDTVGTPQIPRPTAARAAVLANLEARLQAADSNYPESRLGDLLPNGAYGGQQTGEVGRALAVVVGNVVDARAGAAYYSPGDAPRSTQLEDFSDARAQWRVIEVTLNPTHIWGRVVADEPIVFGLVVDSEVDPASALLGASSLGNVVVVLDQPGFFSHSPDLAPVRQNGALLGNVSEDGKLAFPLLPDSKRFLAGIETVQDLAAAAHDPGTP